MMASWSLPTRGAWIEILLILLLVVLLLRRSPHGERGLKSLPLLPAVYRLLSLPTRGAWIEIATAAATAKRQHVAPHTGSVD